MIHRCTSCRIIIDPQGALSHPPTALTHFASLFALQKESFSVILSLFGCDDETHPDKYCWISQTFKTPAGCFDVCFVTAGH